MVQRNFPCCFKQQEERPIEIYERLLSNVAALAPDLVVLPESALCEFGEVDHPQARRFAEWVAKKTNGAALLAGGSRAADGRLYNSAALYTTNAVQIYDKVHLVPFGEFIPGDKWISALQQLAPVGSCTPGELKLLKFGVGTASVRQPVEMGVAICFEDTDSAQMRALARQGAKLLVFITNDSWFSNSIEAEQHAWQAVARAIETGLPVVRVGNSGVTGTIAPDGKASWLLGPNGRALVDAEGTMFDRVEVASEGDGRRRTVYVALGDLPLSITFTLLIMGIILVKYAYRYE